MTLKVDQALTLKVDQAWTSLRRLREGGLDDLVARHHEELLSYDEKAAMPHAPDWSATEKHERQGILRAIGAWDGPDLVGYAAWELIAPRLSRISLIASEIGVYLEPAYRGGFAGLGLLGVSEKLLRVAGCRLATTSSRPGFSVMADILVKLGYRPTEVIHTKVL